MNSDMEDHELLREFVHHSSEDAFGMLVERHLRMVLSAARRMMNDEHLAQDVTQIVFTTLAQKARGIRPPQVVGGWLYNTTRHVAMHAVRTERRRRAREEIGRLNGLAAERAVRDGEAALAAGREEEALAHWRRAQALVPSEALAERLRELEVQRFVRAGIALYGQQRFQEAAFQFRKALALLPDHAEALRHLAYISGAGPQSPLSERFSRLE